MVPGILDRFLAATFLVLMLTGFYTGWSLNKLIAQKYGKWSSSETEAIFSKSEVPLSWFKEGGFREYSAKVKEWLENEENSENSSISISIKSGILFYILISLNLIVLNPLIEGRSINSWAFALWPAPLYAIGMTALIFIAHKYSFFSERKKRQYLKTTAYFKNDGETCFGTVQSKIDSKLDNFLTKCQLLFGIVTSTFILALAIFMTNYVVSDELFDIPPKEELQESIGHVLSAEKKDSLIVFDIAEFNFSFAYPTNAGSYDKVLEVLKNREKVTVLHKEHLSNSQQQYTTVYELVSKNSNVRSYEQSKRSLTIWRVVSGILSLLFLAFGLLAFYGTRVEYKGSCRQ